MPNTSMAEVWARALCFLITVVLIGSPVSGAPRLQDKTPAFEAPTVPLDSRVNPSRITELPEPQLPAHLVAPLPASHRISAGAATSPADAATDARARQAIASGLAYLSKSQSRRGAWMEGDGAAATDQKRPSPAATLAVTALAAKALIQAGRDRSNSPSVARALDYLRAGAMKTGGFNPDPTGALGNYVASAIASAAAGLEDPADRLLLDESLTWLRGNQWDQTEGLPSKADWFGGSGYGNNGRPDLSNTQMMLDAMHDAGVSPDDPAVQRALAFVARAQNLKATNGADWAQNGTNDGGFVYTPANGGESFASDAAGEGRYGEKTAAGQPRSLRSYGSMTYAGYKSLLYAGLGRDDPRVAAARKWLIENWTLSENPGLKMQGYYYYLHAMARALAAGQESVLVDSAGISHNWRSELVDALVARQRPDGSWMNPADRWQEGEADLVTAYAVLALEEALKETSDADRLHAHEATHPSGQ
ncbi:MAG: hypothetical protein EXS00_00230 [Phycisphaerales bacterium]|nr:hypothetical protein [Phycisphaerales bacterium]